MHPSKLEHDALHGGAEELLTLPILAPLQETTVPPGIRWLGRVFDAIREICETTGMLMLVNPPVSRTLRYVPEWRE